ncbi:MAG: M1 family metallopeptidase [Sorangiineae bacterium]|nr:M1 family metallopeptidase [Polyangiaceae bacterium]MEB2324347.1 M1 family metallopeptidase [Sorangiineae bacterium]
MSRRARGGAVLELALGLGTAALGAALLGATARRALPATPAAGSTAPPAAPSPAHPSPPLARPEPEPAHGASAPGLAEGEGAGPARGPDESSGEVQTLRPGAPPRTLGPRYDDDRALPARAEEVASYEIDARYDSSARTISARSVIRFRNTSREPLRELYFHLYLNAFKNDRTLFLRSPFGAGRSGGKATDFGYLDVERLAVRELGGDDLWPGADPHSPGDADDQTDIRVPLPAAVLPGQHITIELGWEARLPLIVERTGYAGSFVMAGQWFPKLARLEPDGSFAHFAFHPQSEFYADYGRYAVTLDVPAQMVVGATGERVASTVKGERRIDRFEADSVHDFAWTAWDGFRERSETIDGVAVRLLYPPGHERNAERELDAVRFALPFFGRRFGRYPYPTLTVVHPPDYARNAGGMEYPTLITTGGPWYASLLGVRAVESVTIHELGHQWFYGLIATDEHAWPFLDEGLNTFAEGLAMRAHYGEGSLLSLPGATISGEALRRSIAVAFGHDQPVALPASGFVSFQHMGALVYARTGTILGTLARVYGEEPVLRALGRYARRYRFEHPGPRHFVAAIREAVGDEAADNLERALFERGTVNYVARELASVPARTPGGVFDGASGREVVSRGATPSPARTLGRVLVFRQGSLSFPVDVDLVADDGSVVRRRWSGREEWTHLDYEGPRPLAAAIVDPERRVLLDDDWFDNATRARPAAPLRVLERALYGVELALGALGP